MSGMGSELALMLRSEALNPLGWCLQCLWLLDMWSLGQCGAFVVHRDESVS